MSFARRPAHKRSISLDIELQEIDDPMRPSKHIDETFRRVQIHVHHATGLPPPSRGATKPPAAYVRVQSAEFDNLPVALTSGVAPRGTDPSWEENLTPFLTRVNKQITLAVYHRAPWPAKHVELCFSEPFTIGALLDLQASNGNTPLALDMNLAIPQPLGSPMPRLFLCAREIASRESARVAINRSKSLRVAAAGRLGGARGLGNGDERGGGAGVGPGDKAAVRAADRLAASESLRRARSVSVSFAQADEATSSETVSSTLSVVTAPR